MLILMPSINGLLNHSVIYSFLYWKTQKLLNSALHQNTMVQSTDLDQCWNINVTDVFYWSLPWKDYWCTKMKARE